MRACVQVNSGAEGAVSKSTQTALLLGPAGNIRGNDTQPPLFVVI